MRCVKQLRIIAITNIKQTIFVQNRMTKHTVTKIKPSKIRNVMYYRAVDFAPRELRPLHTNLANTPRALTFTIKSLHQKKKSAYNSNIVYYPFDYRENVAENKQKLHYSAKTSLRLQIEFSLV